MLTIKKFEMIENSESIAVAISGGVDSVSLLHFLKENFIKKNIMAIHLNHNLRGSESIRDENFVKNLCKNWGIKLFLKSCDIFEISKKVHKGIEECARDFRYDFFNEISEKTGSKVAVAHTLSDSIETIIFNLTRGSGIDGIRGIPSIRDNIIRPFVFVPRFEIENYAKNNNLSYITDSSNFSPEFARNRIRMFVIPQIKKINPSFECTFERFLYQINRDCDFLNELSSKYLEKKINDIKILPEAIRYRVLKTILSQFSDSFEFRHIKLADDLIKSKINAFTMPKNIKIFIKDEHLTCQK
jgi:tRNA(Ile)-lysidine synthase